MSWSLFQCPTVNFAAESSTRVQTDDVGVISELFSCIAPLARTLKEIGFRERRRNLVWGAVLRARPRTGAASRNRHQ